MAHYSTMAGKSVHRHVCISASSLSVEKELYQFPVVGLRTRGCYHTCISIAASPHCTNYHQLILFPGIQCHRLLHTVTFSLNA